MRFTSTAGGDLPLSPRRVNSLGYGLCGGTHQTPDGSGEKPLED